MSDTHEQLGGGDAPSWGARLRRRRGRPPRRALLASVLLHGLLVAVFWAAGLRIRPAPEFVQYRVTLVSPPPQVEAEPASEPPAPTTPVAVQPQPEPPKPKPPEPKPKPPEPKPEPPKPKPEPPKTETAPKPVEKPPEPTPSRGRNADARSTGGENLNVRLEGKEFPYPDYLENITRQLGRYFRWNGPANLEAEVVFYIQRDGSVGGLRIVRKSGNFNFDLQAHEAVDQAGKARAFGPLPDGWQSDRLWISFTFEPPK